MNFGFLNLKLFGNWRNGGVDGSAHLPFQHNFNTLLKKIKTTRVSPLTLYSNCPYNSPRIRPCIQLKYINRTNRIKGFFAYIILAIVSQQSGGRQKSPMQTYYTVQFSGFLSPTRIQVPMLLVSTSALVAFSLSTPKRRTLILSTLSSLILQP